jgi:dolichol-phosphate mannosyltransferase
MQPKNGADLSIILPVYNEADNISMLVTRLESALNAVTEKYEIIFSADPCTDNTVDLILELKVLNPRIKLLVLSRRFGQSAAIFAGLERAVGSACVIMDSDLQDPPELLKEIYSRYQLGADVVHTRRIKRLGENRIRLIITGLGYWLMSRLSSTNIPRNVGEYKLLSRRVVNHLLSFREANIFLKGLISYIGYKQDFIEYVRDARYAGKPHYSQLWGSIPQALNGIFCYSNKPLQLITIVGFMCTILSIASIIFYIVGKLSGIPFANGIPSVIIFVCFFGGAILFSLGIIGEYIGRIFDEVKSRPRYIIENEYFD